jgi:hypothetical protein
MGAVRRVWRPAAGAGEPDSPASFSASRLSSIRRWRVRAAKINVSAYWGLMGVSFIYGIFHAAGPGHGKAVTSSYLLANQEMWRRLSDRKEGFGLHHNHDQVQWHQAKAGRDAAISYLLYRRQRLDRPVAVKAEMPAIPG